MRTSSLLIKYQTWYYTYNSWINFLNFKLVNCLPIWLYDLKNYKKQGVFCFKYTYFSLFVQFFKMIFWKNVCCRTFLLKSFSILYNCAIDRRTCFLHQLAIYFDVIFTSKNHTVSGVRWRERAKGSVSSSLKLTLVIHSVWISIRIFTGSIPNFLWAFTMRVHARANYS